MAGRLTQCRLCGSEELESVHDFGKTALANEYISVPPVEARPQEEADRIAKEMASRQDRFPLHLVQCQSCKHVQLNYSADPRRMFGHYVYTSGTTRSFTEHLKRLAKDISSEYPGADIVEIGSNDGTLMSFLEGPHRVLGVDPAANLHARNTLVEYWTAELGRKLGKQYKGFELAVALNVFAHVDNLHDFADGVFNALKPFGTFLFEVGHLGALCDGGHYDVVYHEHLDFHSIHALVPFLDRHNLCLYNWRGIPTQGGSIRCWASKGKIDWRGPPEPPPDVSDLSIRIKSHGKKLHEICKKLKPVGGFGAPARLTTLVHNAGLEKLVPRIYDDNPLKIGKYTPGTGIPIRPATEMTTGDAALKEGDTLVLFSWNFATEIKRRFPQFKFIVPFPEIRVI